MHTHTQKDGVKKTRKGRLYDKSSNSAPNSFEDGSPIDVSLILHNIVEQTINHNQEFSIGELKVFFRVSHSKVIK